jgi:hypothetical protein
VTRGAIGAVLAAAVLAGCGGTSASAPPTGQRYPEAFRTGFLRSCERELRGAGLTTKPCTCLLHGAEAQFTRRQLATATAARSGPLHRRYTALQQRCAARAGL